MDPVCFHLLGRPVYWYGVLVAAAFLACIAHLTLLGRRAGYGSAFVSDLAFWIMVSGIAGARAAYVLANAVEFRAAPGLILRVDQGGLVFYGGLLGATVAALLYARFKGVPWAPFSDFVVTALPLGQAIGRLGCFLNGCCFGRPGTAPWCVWAHDALRHPVQIYETALALLIYAGLAWYYPRRSRNGRGLALYLLLYPAARLAVEFWRGDDRLRLDALGLNAAQAVSVALLAVGLALWVLAPPGRPGARTP